ncbi:MAG: ATP-dependent Clp protease proteolytic subunit [Nitrospirae bacterium]|jgi:ClpP class serine protease|nr:ATP-dependent Clp protease proteolytic subunit [Nitrospirota bacterium]
MSIGNLIWLFFLMTMMQPILARKFLEMARERALRHLETIRGTKVIAMVHRQETMSLFGFPVLRYINIEDSEEILRAIKMTDPDTPIDLILHTPGGLVLASTQIAHALSNRKAPVTVFVPHFAMSGGTLIALSASRIVMDENAMLGPVDPQLGEFPAASILRVVEQKNRNDIDDKTLIMADIAEKAILQLNHSLERLLTKRMPAEKARQLAGVLSSGHFTHDYPLTYEELLSFDLPVSTDVPDDVYLFMRLFPQPKQAIPSVSYTPFAPPPGRSGNRNS